jgi:hypothetical protein
VPDEQHNHCSDGGSDQAGTLIGSVPADGLPDEGGDKRADNTENDSKDEPTGIVRPGRQPAGNESCNETDKDDPDDIHVAPNPIYFVTAMVTIRSQSGAVPSAGAINAEPGWPVPLFQMDFEKLFDWLLSQRNFLAANEFGGTVSAAPSAKVPLLN